MPVKQILRPELSTAHLGIEERDLEVEKEIQLVPHVVYLAYTGDVKVGVTRETQVPTRWIDQGATFALPIARTDRLKAGVIEVEMKNHLADKTNWKKMLQTLESDVDLADFREKIKEYFPKDSKHSISSDEDLETDFHMKRQNEYKCLHWIRNLKFYRSTEGQIKEHHEGYVIEFFGKSTENIIEKAVMTSKQKIDARKQKNQAFNGLFKKKETTDYILRFPYPLSPHLQQSLPVKVVNSDPA
ncbi:hypothetical protein FQR65_LT16285 [Abscondita terminalis]|nr:hypothetical protein FQR65_LT16285 [Abscondita terminalis]